ncbi:ATP-binding protein [Silvimonas amylolytica]|uniref:histidine kinase n=1 Tax=Silvimonas amylolytica TaxID=449663 RepID=A0ABQ2PHG9_9NEIS|nr:ATP-binding protein [Silvimonas amylolytica]GGP24419.1 hypothetical protein GCM10010971_02380 [Silvimonas amylolytica]
MLLSGVLFCCFTIPLILVEHLRASSRKIRNENLKMRQRIEMHESLLDGLPIAVFAIHSNGEVIESNRAYREMVNQGISGVLPMRTQQEGSTRDLPASIKDFYKEIHATSRPHYQDMHLQVGGTTRDVYFWSVPFYETHGIATGCLGGWLDISDRTQLEADLRAAKDEADAARSAMEEASKAKSTFLSGITHEIRTPLNVIIGSLEIGALNEQQPSSARRRPQEMALEAAHHLLGLIDDILDFSKIEAGKLTMHTVPTQVSTFLTDTGALFETPMHQRGLTFSHDFSNISPSVWAAVDATRLRQILVNLLSNAMKFTGEGGRIQLLAACTPINETHIKLEASVTDTGIGISASDQQRLFQPFNQADNSRIRMPHATRGTGLGLAICKQLITMMGGTITLQSTLEKGTKVSLELVLPQAQPVISSAHLATTPATRPRECRRVLLVDDHVLNLTVLTYQFQQLGCDVVQADGGEEALARLNSDQFDLIITDYSMPGMDGPTLTRRIRQLETARQTTPSRIIGLTAHTQHEYRNAALAAGMDECLHKPVGMKAWSELLDRTPSITSTASAASIQLDVVSGIAQGNQAHEIKLLSTLLAGCAADWQSVQLAWSDQQWAHLKDAGHRIKGVARMFGFTDLSTACEQLERAALAADVSLDTINAIKQALDGVSQAATHRLEALRSTPDE